MKNILEIFYAPSLVFQRLKEKPAWLTPLLIILVISVLNAVLTVTVTKDIALSQQEEILRERGLTEEQIATARKFMQGPGPAILGGIAALVVVTIIMLLFSLIINVLLPPMGGISNYKTVFAVVTHSSLVRIPGDILRFILILMTKSIYATTSLAALAPNLTKTAPLYRLLSQIDIFLLWEIILIATGITITNRIKKSNAYYLVFGIWLVTILLSVFAGGLFGGRR